MIRKAVAKWQGTGKEGKGQLSTESGVLEQVQYSYHTRFEDGIGTNPEELIAAAHAGCFTMKLSFNLTGAGYEPKNLETTCNITFVDGTIKNSHLVIKAEVEGISETQFAELVSNAEENCPVSKVLNTKITHEFSLNS